MSIIVTGIYSFETPFKTDSCLHNYVHSLQYGCRGSPCGKLPILQSLFVGQYHTRGSNCPNLSFLLRLFSVLGYVCFPCVTVTDLVNVSNVSEEPSTSIFMIGEWNGYRMLKCSEQCLFGMKGWLLYMLLPNSNHFNTILVTDVYVRSF